MPMHGKRDDTVVHEREPFNAEPSPAALDGQRVTPTDSFFSRNHGPIPEIDPRSWHLRVDGAVDRTLELSLDELRRSFAARNETVTLQCAGNRRDGLIQVRDIPAEHPWGRCAIGTARWTGVLLADVLDAAGVQPEARHIAFAAPDVSQIAHPPQPYGGSVPVSKATAGEVLLAWEMNEEPLSPVHGAPLRAVVPGYIGARSVKWLERVTAQREPSANYFQAVAYHLLPATVEPSQTGAPEGIPLGPVSLSCEILRPGDGEVVRAGRTAVSGYAHVGADRTVARVDVSADSGRTWHQADLSEQHHPWTWRLWQATVVVAPGPLHIVARAWDDTGSTQPESTEQIWNPKGYMNNSWARVRLSVT
ncbi:MAG: putative oxidoreductase [Nocardioidaceae bacterium]|nr:putative oxidoreductase [Nocardioidaceae bacterium]